jgi:hypothetical protein
MSTPSFYSRAVDPVARGALQAKGWKVEEKFAERLLKK